MFIKNKTLAYILIIELLWHFGFNAVESNIKQRIYKDKDFDRDTLVSIGLICSPI